MGKFPSPWLSCAILYLLVSSFDIELSLKAPTEMTAREYLKHYFLSILHSFFFWLLLPKQLSNIYTGTQVSRVPLASSNSWEYFCSIISATFFCSFFIVALSVLNGVSSYFPSALFTFIGFVLSAKFSTSVLSLCLCIYIHTYTYTCVYIILLFFKFLLFK